ncbi:MAG: hypothetical protein QUU85_02055 [Candidatus Eisenbacteria bacterium]|nr:hypothetical protein [Candidatus Eisenbacteria bacterium]
MSVRRFLLDLDRRWIFLAVGIAVLIPLLVRIGFQIRPTPFAIAYEKAIEDLPAGSVIYLATDFDPGSMPELYPMLVSSMQQAFRKDLRVVSGSLWPAAPPLVDRAFEETGARMGKRYGVDFVNLGFKEGREAVMVRLGTSIPGTYPRDARGNPVTALPVMRGIRNFDQIRLIVNISAGYPGTKEWVQQVRTRFDVPIVAGTTAVSAPEYYPYVQAGQLQGLLGGLAGAAEYEELLGTEGDAVRGMDAQSLGHLVILLFIIAGNVLAWTGRRKPGESR